MSIDEKEFTQFKESVEFRLKLSLEEMFVVVGEKHNREGLKETPDRFLKAFDFWCKGYKEKPEDVLKVFQDGVGENNTDEMIFQANIPIYSLCEHHLAPFFGVAHIAYMPDGMVLGLSKLARVADIFARRLQTQERLTSQIADTLMDKPLKPRGVGVILQMRHMCMESRGVQKQGTVTTTSALRGVLKADPEVRAEFMSLLNSVRRTSV